MSMLDITHYTPNNTLCVKITHYTLSNNTLFFSVYNILCMAHQEMTVVSVLPVDTIRAHLHKLVFYYGVGDQWNTTELCPRIQQLFPQGDITLCRHGYKHDFVLESANEMAEYCCDKMTHE